MFSNNNTFPNKAFAAPLVKRPASVVTETVAGKVAIASFKSFSICAYTDSEVACVTLYIFAADTGSVSNGMFLNILTKLK